MAKVFKEKGSRKVWVLRLRWSDKNLSETYSVKSTRGEARSLKKDLSGLIEMGTLLVSLHKGNQSIETGALLVGQKKYY